MDVIRKHTDPWTAVVIVVTLLLFAAALFVKGLTHDLLLEAGVFLVSLKLIIMGYKQAVASARLEAELQQVHAALELLRNAVTRGDRPPAP